MEQHDCQRASSDGELIERIRGGSMEAFDALVERYRQGIYRLAFAMVQNHETADDLSQEVFVLAFKRIRQLRDANSVGAWLRKILVNFCIRHSKIKRHVSLDDAEPIAGETPFMIVEKAIVKERVMNAVLELEPHERAVILLYYMEGFKQTEVADILGCPIGTVWSRLSSARGKLRGRLTDVISDVSDGVENV